VERRRPRMERRHIPRRTALLFLLRPETRCGREQEAIIFLLVVAQAKVLEHELLNGDQGQLRRGDPVMDKARREGLAVDVRRSAGLRAELAAHGQNQGRVDPRDDGAGPG
jgi:hypothetical protein